MEKMKLETFGELIQLYQRIVACYRLEFSLQPMLLRIEDTQETYPQYILVLITVSGVAMT